jgi:outer membrane usher protein
MSIPAPARRRRQFAVVGFVVALLPLLPAPALGAAGDDPVPSRQPGGGSAKAEPARTMLIARVQVNTVNKGDVAILRDAQGHTFVPLAEYAKWGLSPAGVASVTVDGESYVEVSAIPGLDANFDPRTVTLELRVAASALPATRINLGPARRTDVIFPVENSFFFNYGFDAAGDDAFGQRQYQFATELAARSGNWLFYNTTSQQWGSGTQNGFTRLLTNLQYDDRPNLRRWTIGDFFTPGFDVNGSVPLSGASLTKLYSMDPNFVQYPTAAFTTEVAFPSTVQVRIDGNLIAQRQVQPGPVDITNITNGLTGGQNVSVVLRDPFGREQTLQQPFFFATNEGLAEGLHEYSYNLGFLRRQYGIESGDYGDIAASAFHRYAFTNQLTLGLRGQATQSLYNFGPFGTYQSPLGILGVGASFGGRDGGSGPAASAAYSYTGSNFSVNLGSLYRARNYAQLSDLTSDFRVRGNQYASGSLYFPALGTLTATYNGLTSYDGPQAKIANVTYTRSVLATKGLLSLSYLRTIEPQITYGWSLSFRYFFDVTTSLAAAVGGSNSGSTQALSLQKSVPQGQGVGYELTVGRFDSDAPDAMFGRAFVQANVEHAALGAEYSRASRVEGGPGLARVFASGSIGGVGGRLFAARPVQDSFALVRVSELKEVPVYANGWFVGRTDSSGEVVATNIAAYYDNFISFGTKELPLDYVFPRSEIVISPPTRSGTLVAFAVRKNRAIVGMLMEIRDGKPTPLEFREIGLVRGDTVIRSFTARRGEFYVDGVEPGEYLLQQDTGVACSVRIHVPDLTDAMTDIGTAVCQPAPR